MKIFKKWIRIGDLGICCPICGKPDWCRVSKNGEYVLCSRIPVYSQGGSLHKLTENIKTNGIANIDNYYPPINWYALNKSYGRNCPLWRLNQFGALKGISPVSLIKLNMGYDGSAYTFPIFNENFSMVGLQRQFPDGIKSMVKGSKLGIFIPTTYQEGKSPVVITEGVSDTAIALDLGLNAVGRLNCSSGTEILIKILVNKPLVEAYIVADNDKAGKDGALKLANDLIAIGCQVKVIIPPFKDLRNWKRKTNLTIEEFNSIVERLPVYGQ